MPVGESAGSPGPARDQDGGGCSGVRGPGTDQRDRLGSRPARTRWCGVLAASCVGELVAVRLDHARQVKSKTEQRAARKGHA